MKLRIIKAVVLALSVVVLLQLTVAAAPKYIIFNFKSNIMNKVQQRLLRDTIVKEIYNSKNGIVPVMQLQVLLQQLPKQYKITIQQMQGIVKKTAATHFVFGELRNSKVKNIVELTDKQQLIVTIHIIEPAAHKNKTISFTVKGQQSLYELYSVIVSKIVLQIKLNQ